MLCELNLGPPNLNFTTADVTHLVSHCSPKLTTKRVETLAGGLINKNLKVEFEETQPPVVLRFYQHGSDVCRKEIGIHRLIEAEVPVARMLHAQPDGLDGSPPFTVLEFVPGIAFRELKRSGNLDAVHEAAYSAGKTLATIGRFSFEKPGKLVAMGASNHLTVGEPFVAGANTIPRLMETFLSSELCERRAGPHLIDQLHRFIWSYSTELADLENDHTLVHSDYGNRNILVRSERGKWTVRAILDWEFAFSGCPLLDVGHFLRYEDPVAQLREPSFSTAYVEHGGILKDNWRELARVVDLTGLVESLAHQDLPEDAEIEILELTKATLERRNFCS